MSFIYNDIKYIEIINDILLNKEFSQIKDLEHHGVTRFEHSLKVSYIAYRLSKFFRVDYQTVARGGLLHDFFITENERNMKDRLISTLTHPFKALENAKKQFDINDKEANIIESHMFLINPRRIPKYIESWIVMFTDTIIGTIELSFSLKNKASTYAGFALLFLTNYHI